MSGKENKAKIGGPEKGIIATKAKPAGEKEPPKVTLCDTCLYMYPRCGGDLSPGFKTENGSITECSGYQVKAGLEPEVEFRSEPEPVKVKPSGKSIPERLRLKRKIQEETLAETEKKAATEAESAEAPEEE